MTTEKTLLQQIRERELLLNIKIEDTRRDADEVIVAAERDASSGIENAELAEAAAARSYYEREMSAVQREVEMQKEQGAKQAQAIREAGERNLPRAIEKIVKAVSME